MIWTSPTTAIARITSPTASEMNCRCRAWRFCSRWGSRLMRTMSVKASHRQTAADEEQRGIRGKLPRPDTIRHRHVRERVADDGVDAGTLPDQLVQGGNQRATAGEHDLVDLVVGGRGEEELQRPGYLKGQRFHERLQHIGVIILRQARILLRRLGFLGRQVEGALD